MLDLLLSPPWWLLVLLLAVGGVVAWSGNQRSESRTRNIGLGIIGLAIVMFTVGRFYETDVEQVTRLNGDLVQSVPKQDWSRFADLLEPDATLGTVGGSLFNNRDAIVAGAKGDVSRWGLQSVTITNANPKQDAAGVTVDFTALSKQTATEGFLPMTTSSWRMVWERDGKSWRCHQIICTGIGQDSGAGVTKWIK